MFVASVIGLVVVAAVTVVALNAARIPWLRELVGAAPMQQDQEDQT